MQTASTPSSNGSSWSAAPDRNRSCRENNAVDAQFSSFSFPPKTVKDAQATLNESKPDHESLVGQQLEPTESESIIKPNYKAYRSMSAPGVFPLKRRQSNNSPLRMISYTEETSGEPCAVPEYYSNNVIASSPSGIGSPPWSPPTSRGSVDYSDPKYSIQHLRRTSSPGTFTLKHMRQPSPLGLGSLVQPPPRSPSTASFEGSSYFSDAVTEQYSHYGSESSNVQSRPTSHVYRAASLDAAFGNMLEFQRPAYNQYRPRMSKSSGSFSLKHQNRPSPLGTQLPLSPESESGPSLMVNKEFGTLQTILDESSSTQK